MSSPSPAPGQALALVIDPRWGIGLADEHGTTAIAHDDPCGLVAELDQEHQPRWTWWGRDTVDALVAASVPIDRCWDVAAVHRLLAGGWRNPIEEVWAWLNDIDPATAPKAGQLDFSAAGAEQDTDPNDPVRSDGHLKPDWVAGGWRNGPHEMAAWAKLALTASQYQRKLLGDPRVLSTAHAESMAEYLCAELEHHGLPVDTDEATRIIADAAGPRPATRADEEAEQARRDAEVLRHLELRSPVNLRNPADVKAMLASAGIDLPDTRAWRMEKLRDDEPLIDALLSWRKAERIATTYGYHWLDEHVTDGRLRGQWSSADGAAGRMTASAGLHNLPAPMRTAVRAEAGNAFVRADLGQIEPRVLAAVSGDRALIEATAEDDLYQPVARSLDVDREVAKVAVLGAMYGATTGQSAGALRGLERSYPVAMAFLQRAADQGKLGNDVITVGGRRIRMGGGSSPDGDLDRAIAAAEARGRYARNAVIQGAAAEFFKVWAVIVRRRLRPLGAAVVLCLHDELLVQTPIERAEEAAAEVDDAVGEAAFYWSPDQDVRFTADVGVVQRWSEAKP